MNGMQHLKCKKGHIWNATFANVKYRGSWCPFCQNKRENICREIVTNYLGPPSENCWPDFLKTPKYSRGLQLNIFYLEHSFVIEVQGEQHEKYIEFFHKEDLNNNFIKQQAWNQLKKKLCKENWIDLRYIWYYEDSF